MQRTLRAPALAGIGERCPRAAVRIVVVTTQTGWRLCALAVPDDDFLATLWDRHADQVYAYARRRVGATDAPDVVSEVFAVAVAKRAKVPDDALPWLYRTAWNVIANHWRAEDRRARLVTASTEEMTS